MADQRLEDCIIIGGGPAGLTAAIYASRAQLEPLVIDGPFAETKELVAGFWMWKCASLQEAIDWVKRCPNPMPGPSDLEIRPLWESEDFGPEIAAKENELRARIAANPA